MEAVTMMSSKSVSDVGLVGETNERPISVEKAQKLNPSKHMLHFASLSARVRESETERVRVRASETKCTCVCAWARVREMERE